MQQKSERNFDNCKELVPLITRQLFSRLLPRSARAMFFALAIATITGCAITPQPQLDMSNYSTPSVGTAGVYFYQWKTGIIGAGSDVKFLINGKALGAINTGEWLYMEVPAGQQNFRMIGGIFPADIPFQFHERQNYFFRGQLVDFSDQVIWVNDKKEIDEAIANIESGRYEKGDID